MTDTKSAATCTDTAQTENSSCDDKERRQRPKKSLDGDVRTYQASAEARISEAELEACVIQCAQKLGYLVAHFGAARTAGGWRTPTRADANGFPDLVLARDPHPAIPEMTARLLFVELKAKRGRVGQFQQLWLDVLTSIGAETYVWKPVDWLSGRVEAILRGEETK